MASHSYGGRSDVILNNCRDREKTFYDIYCKFLSPLLHISASYKAILSNDFAYQLQLTTQVIPHFFFRYPRKWLHQCQLHRWLQETECVHRHPRISARDIWWILEDDLGAEECHHRHDDQTGGEVQGKRQKYRHSHFSETLSISPTSCIQKKWQG